MYILEYGGGAEGKTLSVALEELNDGFTKISSKESSRRLLLSRSLRLAIRAIIR